MPNYPTSCRTKVFWLIALLLASPAYAGDRAWVGIDIADLPEGQRRKLGITAGVSVLLVHEDSPAATAGLAAGDIIVTIDGQVIANIAELICAIVARLPGSITYLMTIREAEMRSVWVTLGRWPKDLLATRPKCPPSIGRTSLNPSRSKVF
jgi:S1-C subfamily serine protease